jgi:rare lipoprotein A
LKYKKMQALLRSILSTIIVISVASCSATPSTIESPPNNSRYSIEQDRAPSGAIDVSALPEVFPEPVNRTLAGNRSPYVVLGKTYVILPTEEGYSERGVASWYGEKFHGHKTSNGEIFSMYEVSAAHKSLPIPSFLRVTNLDNNRSIVVRVNDRGPFHGERIIDLSYAAAVKLGYADRGTARVQLDAITVKGSSRDKMTLEDQISNPETLGNSKQVEQFLQVGAFSDINTAQAVSNKLKGMTDRPIFIRSITNSTNDVFHRVRIGPINDPIEIQQLTERLVAAKFGRPYTISR